MKVHICRPSDGRQTRASVHAALAILLCGALTSVPRVSRADDFIVYSPYIIASQNEIEVRGYRYADARPSLGGDAAEVSVSRGVSEWWKPEIYLLKYQQSPGSGGGLLGYEFENTFLLTPPGKYWLDVGLLASFEHQTVANMPNALEFGPLIARTSGRFTHIVNLIWEKQVGAGGSSHSEFRSSYFGTYAVSQVFRPGLEAYVRPADHAYQCGPIVAGEWHLPGTSSNLEYRVGVVLGINAHAPRQTWLARLEYEFY